MIGRCFREVPSIRSLLLYVVYAVYIFCLAACDSNEQIDAKETSPSIESAAPMPSIVLDGDSVMEAGEITDDLFFARITAEQERDIIDKAFPLLAAKWAVNNIFVCWESLDDQNVDARASVKAAVINSWAAVSSLEFLGWGLCHELAQGIRIAIRDEGPHVQSLGKFINGIEGGMVLNFEYQNWGQGCQQRLDYCNRVIAVHEFGHAIGFAHEQNRPDTPGDCDKRQGNDGDTTDLTPWDPDSVMNYCNPVYSNNGVLSEFDILAVRHIYGDA